LKAWGRARPELRTRLLEPKNKSRTESGRRSKPVINLFLIPLLPHAAKEFIRGGEIEKVTKISTNRRKGAGKSFWKGKS